MVILVKILFRVMVIVPGHLLLLIPFLMKFAVQFWLVPFWWPPRRTRRVKRCVLVWRKRFLTCFLIKFRRWRVGLIIVVFRLDSPSLRGLILMAVPFSGRRLLTPFRVLMKKLI